MRGINIVILGVIGGAIVGDALKGFRISFIDALVFMAVWYGLILFGGNFLLGKKSEPWMDRRTEGETAAIVFGVPAVLAVVGWYLVDHNSGPYARMHGITSYLVLFLLAWPLGVFLTALLGPELFPDDETPPDVTVLPPENGCSPRIMGPQDYHGTVLNPDTVAPPETDFAFDPTRFNSPARGNTGPESDKGNQLPPPV